ncbi:CRISPR system Cascade subunit CasE [Spinactinospora alkalitolerans]|uniref:CRISPR system Cascade subunit CasE n=1 Tax=Spinactinospora alkalitolerans TaxID=687207 RepID=A0A852U3J5_9ACTN|nr:type I-E CRISPR-associated protein Cas6/Cse3/CasE [Spinactinospora alkalitolerans]NYE50065.1 CRISPR system Cascade subunit CasE [Spinactinospora alkalitolerans]
MNAWLTQITLNQRHPGIAKQITDANRLHQELMFLAPDDLGERPRSAAGLLYRLEETPAGVKILVQTHTQPRLDRLTNGFAATIVTRELTPLLKNLSTGAHVRYRIAANPTQRVGNSTTDPRRKGKLTVLTGERGELWWLARATTNGLHPFSLTQSRLPDICAGKTRHAATRFDGVGVVTDADLLRQAILNGIGRAKSYGCGLLSLGPAQRPE